MKKKTGTLSESDRNKLLNQAVQEPAIQRNNPKAWIKIVEKVEKERPKK